MSTAIHADVTKAAVLPRARQGAVRRALPCGSRLSRAGLASLVALGSALLAGCAPRGSVPTVPSDRDIAAYSRQDGVAIALVYEPAQCFSCFGALQGWVEWGRENPGRLRLLFTRAPSPEEQRQLAIYRIAPDAVLTEEQWPSAARLETPLEYLITDGQTRRVTPITSDSASTRLLTVLSKRFSAVDLARPNTAAELLAHLP
jgi:hypothetical protein